MILNRALGGLRRTPWPVLSAAWVAAVGVAAWQLTDGVDVLPGFAVTPALTVAVGARRRAVLASGVLALTALGGDLADDSMCLSGPVFGIAGTVLAVIAAGMWAVGRRSTLTAELDRFREIATAAQEALLRPLPHRVGDWTVTAEYLSASRGAQVGGDFYEVLATPFGTRVLIGDARGHGLPAIGMVAALLGSFREAAHQEPDLSGVLHRLDAALRRHLRERPPGDRPAYSGGTPQDPVAEEFATVQLVQLTDDGGFQVVNCGHPPPYRLGPRTAGVPLGEPLPPLGVFDPQRVKVSPAGGRLVPGEGLLLYTDGIQDARDSSGRFFPLPATLDVLTAVPLRGPDVTAGLRAAVSRHTGGHSADDMALLILIREPRTPARTSCPPRPPALTGTPRR